MASIDIQSAVVGWASLVVTTIGLGGLITQASAISDQMDPFYSARSVEYLGVWFKRQRHFPWWRIAKPPPLGPVIIANGVAGFCAKQTVYLMRIPPASPGKAGWSTLLAMLHAQMPLAPLPPSIISDPEKAEKIEIQTTEVEGLSVAGDGWGHLERASLSRQNLDVCVRISRTTLIVMLVILNGRARFEFKSTSGFRAAYGSYAGQFYITWPIGEEAIVKFSKHDSLQPVEVLPRFFPIRVDRCCEMACGVVSLGGTGDKVAFPGRKSAGTYRLDLGRHAFQSAHGARHLYNMMMGGKAYEVDFLSARPVYDSAADSTFSTLTVPCEEAGPGSETTVTMIVPPAEEQVIRLALDCLSWTSVSWSLHRGMRDILIAYTKPVMDSYRTDMAQLLIRGAAENAASLQARGWDEEFVRTSMGNMAASALLAGVGDSGDAVRVVTDIVSVMTGEHTVDRLDTVRFWQLDPSERPKPGEKLGSHAIIALTKVFVLEWSQEFDYALNHSLPPHLFFG